MNAAARRALQYDASCSPAPRVRRVRASAQRLARGARGAMAPPNVGDFSAVLRRAAQRMARAAASGEDPGDEHVVAFCGLLSEGGTGSTTPALESLEPYIGSPHPADVVLGLTTLHEAVGNFVVPPGAPARDAPARHPFADALARLAEARWVARFMEVAETHARDEATMTAMRDCVEDWTRRCGGSDAESARIREIFQALADACLGPGGAASTAYVAAAPAESRDSSEFLPRGMVEMSGLAPPPTMTRGRVETRSGFLPEGLVEMSGMTRGDRRL